MKYIIKKPLPLDTKSLLVFFIFSCWFSVAMIDSAEAKPLVIKFAHSVADDTPKGQTALHLKKLIKERLGDDKVIVEVYPNSELFTGVELGDALLRNDIQLAAPSMSQLKKYTQRLQVLDLPFIFVTPEAADNFLKGPYGARMLRLVKPSGLIGLGYLNNGMKQLSASKPITVPADLNGLKYRIMESDVLASQFEAVNAIPLKRSFSQVYSLLKSKEIDGQENTWSNIFSKKFYEHQPYILESNHGYLGYMVLSSSKFWETLPGDLKVVIEQALKDALEFGNNVALQKAQNDRNSILEAGVSNIHIMSLEERKAWVKSMQAVWQQYKDQVGSELIQAAASSR